MIPNYVLNGLGPGDRVAILARRGVLHFFVHPASDGPEAIRAYAARDGSEVLTTHMKDQAAITAFGAAARARCPADVPPALMVPVRLHPRPVPSRATPVRRWGGQWMDHPLTAHR